MTRKRKKKQKRKVNKGIFPKVILTAFVIYAVVTLTSLIIETNTQNAVGDEKQAQYESLTAYKESVEQLVNDEIDPEYIISEAQKEGYAASNERVFKDVDVAGQ